MLKWPAIALILISFVLLSGLSGCQSPTLAVRMGTESIAIRQNLLGKAIVPMEEFKVKAMQLQPDLKTIKEVEVTVKIRTVIRVGIQYIGRDDQILTKEKIEIQAMVPDANNKLVKVDKLTIDENTGIKIGTATWEPLEEEPAKSTDTK